MCGLYFPSNVHSAGVFLTMLLILGPMVQCQIEPGQECCLGPAVLRIFRAIPGSAVQARAVALGIEFRSHKERKTDSLIL